MAGLFAKFAPQIAAQATQFAEKNPNLIAQAKGVVQEQGGLDTLINKAAEYTEAQAQQDAPSSVGIPKDELLAALASFYKERRTAGVPPAKAKEETIEYLNAIVYIRNEIEARGLGGKRKKTKKSKKRSKKTLRRRKYSRS